MIEDLIKEYGLWAVFFGTMIEGDLTLLILVGLAALLCAYVWTKTRKKLWLGLAAGARKRERRFRHCASTASRKRSPKGRS